MGPSKKYNHTMDRKRLKITLKILNDVKQEYPGIKKYIENRLEEECSKENGKYISRRGNFSFYIPRSKELSSTEKTFFILWCQALKQKGFHYI